MHGLLVNKYPKISETFVLQEILELQKKLSGLNVFSMHQPTDDSFHRKFNLVSVDVTYLSTEYWLHWSVIKTHVKLIFNRLWPYLSTLKFTLTRPEGGTFRQFCQAVYFSGLLQEKGIQHVHVHSVGEPSGLAELASRLCGISYSISANAKDIYLEKPSILHRKVSQAQFVVTFTDYNRQPLYSINNQKQSIFRVYHGVNRVTILTKNVLPRKMRILSVGRQRNKKGFPALIAACKLLVQTGYNFQCDIVAYELDWEELQTLIERYQLQHTVKVQEKINYQEMSSLSRHTSTYEIPYQITNDGRRDCISNVLKEALIFGVPVMPCDISGIPELIENNKTGLVIEAKKYHALFTPLHHSLDISKLCLQMSVVGRQCVATHNVHDQYIGFLKELLSHE